MSAHIAHFESMLRSVLGTVGAALASTIEDFSKASTAELKQAAEAKHKIEVEGPVSALLSMQYVKVCTSGNSVSIKHALECVRAVISGPFEVVVPEYSCSDVAVLEDLARLVDKLENSTKFFGPAEFLQHNGVPLESFKLICEKGKAALRGHEAKSVSPKLLDIAAVFNVESEFWEAPSGLSPPLTHTHAVAALAKQCFIMPGALKFSFCFWNRFAIPHHHPSRWKGFACLEAAHYRARFLSLAFSFCFRTCRCRVGSAGSSSGDEPRPSVRDDRHLHLPERWLR